jgi:hypothetical protein
VDCHVPPRAPRATSYARTLFSGEPCQCSCGGEASSRDGDART